MNLTDVKRITIPQGEVSVIACGTEILWRKQKYKTVLPYIESTGTQWIDTEVCLSNNHSVEIEYQLTTAPQYSKGIYGAYIDGFRYELITRSSGVSANKGYLEYGYGTTAKVGANTDTERHIVRQEKGEIYVDGVLSRTFPTSTFTHDVTAPLGGFEYNGNYTPALAKYYYAKIWDGDTLVRDFVPVLDWNNVPCMYDNVSGKLFRNKGTGAFEYDHFAAFAAEYQTVEYLESTGTQWIDLGIPLTQNSKVEMLISNLDTSATGGKIFGSRSSATENNFSVLFGQVGGIQSLVVDFCNYRDNRFAYAFGEDEFYEISVSSSMMKINESEQVVSVYTDFTTPSNAYLFNCSGSYPAAYGNATMRVHYCKMYDGDSLERDFVPCYRKSDGKSGMYDLATKTFFTNAGTGEFIYE